MGIRTPVTLCCLSWHLLIVLCVCLCAGSALGENAETISNAKSRADSHKVLNCTIEAEGSLRCSNGMEYVEAEGQVSSPYLFIMYTLISGGLVMTAGIMSGLTIGLMGMDLTSLHLLRKAGTPLERKYSAQIIPVVEKHHLLLVTLLLANAAAMEALPIFLDRLVSAGLAIIISVTLVLLFGEVIPQALCTRYGLAIGANLAWLVKVLMILLFVIAWPISKLLDVILGKVHITHYGRAHLRELVRMHEDKNSGPLTADEATIIIGALDMINKTAADIMVPLEEVFMLNEHEKMDYEARQTILMKGHSRIPVYKRQRHRVQGVLMVSSLITVNPDNEVPVKELDLQDMLCVTARAPLYDVLNVFLQSSSSSHDMAMVTMPAEEGSEEDARVVGMITLDDILHELVKEEQRENEEGVSGPTEVSPMADGSEATVFTNAKRKLDFANALRRMSLSIESNIGGMDV